jgi:hypothetical protein
VEKRKNDVKDVELENHCTWSDKYFLKSATNKSLLFIYLQNTKAG